jgi:large repetitive protein
MSHHATVDERPEGRWRWLRSRASWVIVLSSIILGGASMGIGPSATVQAACAPPGAPSGLKATVAKTGNGLRRDQVQLDWTAPTENPSGLDDYRVEWSGDGTTWAHWTVREGNPRVIPTTFTVSGLTTGVPYFFRVAGVNVFDGGCNSPWSTTVTAMTPRWPPPAPSGLQAKPGTPTGSERGAVTLNWTALPEFNFSGDNYRVEWSADGTTWTSDTVAANTTTKTVTGLASGKEFQFRVAGASSFDGFAAGPWSTTKGSTSRLAATAPTSLTAAVAPAPAVGSGQVKLSWSAPADDGGAAISDYVIERSTDGAVWTVVDDGVSTATTYTLTGLTNGTRYSLRVYAKNSVGKGDLSTTVGAMPVWTPTAPSNPSASLSNSPGGLEYVALTWGAALDNGSPITAYLIEASVNGKDWSPVTDVQWSTATTGVVHGLTKGTTYRFRVSAQNTVGRGANSTEVSATPEGKPDAPRGLTAAVAPASAVGSGEVKLSWSAPTNDGGPDVTDYVISMSDGGSSKVVDDGVSTATTYTVHGLANGKRYSFAVGAKNTHGVGDVGTADATPVWTPSAPDGLAATTAPTPGVGSGQVALSWVAPVDNGKPVTGYVIEQSVDGTMWTAVADAPSTATAVTVDGLTNGTHYSYRVAAQNELGVGAWSTVQATPVWLPSAPEDLTAAVAPDPGLGRGEVGVSWSPAIDNGAPITDYLLEMSSDGDTWTAVDDGVSTATMFTVRGLDDATSYQFRVAGLNALGQGPWSLPVDATTPTIKPAAPSGLVAWAPAPWRSGTVNLTWTAPDDDGGSAITDYVIERSSDGVEWTAVVDGESTATTLTVDGLTDGTEYSFRVAAINTAGAGEWSASASTVLEGAPAAPGGLTATVAPAPGVGAGQVLLSWTAPENTGTLMIVDYVIQRSTDGLTWTVVSDPMSTTTTSVVHGLTNGTSYRFRVGAVNAAGGGAWSATARAAPRWTPTAPISLRAAVAPTRGVGSGQVKLTWKLPHSTNGAAVRDYLLQRSVDGKHWTTIRDGVSTTRTRIVTGLRNGTSYRFHIAAVNGVGRGTWSAIVRAIPHAR